MKNIYEIKLPSNDRCVP